jgi:hypothetical protein
MVTIHDEGAIGDLRVSFEWASKPGEDRVQPMMRLRNPIQRRSQMIALSDAWMWDDRGTDADPNGKRAAARIMLQAIQIAEHLYDIPTRAGACRIVDAIMQYLPDLVAMPPRPARTADDWLADAQRSKLVLKAKQGGDPLTLIDFRTGA